MLMRGQFDDQARPFFTEEKPKPADTSHLQGAMFLDRPDLWAGPARRRRAGSRPLANQPSLLREEGD